jgi:hypothetical protein
MARLPEDWLKQIQVVYPRRRGGQGWGYVKKRIPELVRQGEEFDDLLAGAKSYGDYCCATNEQYVRMARTFFGPDEWWMEDYSIEVSKPRGMPKELTDEQRAADLRKFEADMKRLRVVK